jgi:hypothetical protein
MFRDSQASSSPGKEIAGTIGGGAGDRGWCDDFERSGAFVPTAPALTGDAFADRAGEEGGLVEVYGRGNGGGALTTSGARRDFETDSFVVRTLMGEGHDAPRDGTGIPLAFHASQDPVSSTHSSTLCSGATLGVAVPGAAVRRLTPREWERLQGLPDDYTLITWRGKAARDAPRYRAIGNSIAVPVLAWLGRRLEQVDSLLVRKVT